MTHSIISEGLLLSEPLYIGLIPCSDCPEQIAIDREFRRTTWVEAKCPDCFCVNYRMFGAKNASL